MKGNHQDNGAWRKSSRTSHDDWISYANRIETRMWANANLMVALPNIGGALCSTPQSLADAHY